MQNIMVPKPNLIYHDKELTLRGVQIYLRVYPTAHRFTFNASRELSAAEKQQIASYLVAEGFLDMPGYAGGDAETRLTFVK